MAIALAVVIVLAVFFCGAWISADNGWQEAMRERDFLRSRLAEADALADALHAKLLAARVDTTPEVEV